MSFRHTAFILIVCAAVAASAQSVVPIEQRGLAVGDKLPQFALVDQDGRRQTFETLKGTNGLVLLFVRSADW